MPQLSYTEENVIQAMLDVTDNGLSQNQAAQKNGVPQTTLSDRLRGLPSRSEITQPAQLLSKSQESRLVTWILRQEALGYAPSHSQVRATVAALLRQQGRERHIGVHWLARFIKRHPDIETKVGKRQEAARFNSFTPMAVNWYFGIRESEYGWIKPVDKVNFIKAYAKARAVGMTKKNILSGWRVTGNWPISRQKALMHPEIQPDKKETTPGSDGHRDGQVDSDHTPTTSRHIRDLGKNKSPSTRRRYSVISRGFEAQESKIASLGTRIASLEEEVGRLSRGKKRKAIPNPNKRFMTLAEALVAGGAISEPNEAIERADAVEDVIEVGGMEEDERSNSEEEELTVVRTRAGREVRIPRKY
ncbi:hypothetical protein Focb16_v006188 [Fusarium oxysporum f. sp. cubense]|uniref:HTH CENPB-type domain-containing protein n=2 Tax=Fusarium oxysporum TaxID=5507 RepID=A0A559LJC2_FUSOC|nr:hypothetical protein Focb16_v006188 [Fusarium oxysporum f. sp. cubense]